MDRLTLTEALQRAWSRETAVDPDAWDAGVPSTGQCAVTALVLQDHLGGELQRAMVDGMSHYWLRTARGEDVDLTIDQFANPVVEYAASRPRAEVLAHASTAIRYRRLSASVSEELSGVRI